MNTRTGSGNILHSKHVTPSENNKHKSHNVQNVHTFTITADVKRKAHTRVGGRKVAGSIPAGVIGFFIDIKSFRSHSGPGVDPASNRNEYQEYFLGVKSAGA